MTGLITFTHVDSKLVAICTQTLNKLDKGDSICFQGSTTHQESTTNVCMKGLYRQSKLVMNFDNQYEYM